LRELGYRVDSPNDKLPAVIYGRDAVSASQNIGDGGTPSLPRKCTVSIEESSQFASALLLCAKHGGWEVKVVGENAEESPYVAMTSKMIEAFPKNGGKFQIEPDASSGSYFWGAAWLLVRCELHDFVSNAKKSPAWTGRVKIPPENQTSLVVKNWPTTAWQIDAELVKLCWPQMPNELSRKHDLGDSIMTLISLAPLLNSHNVRFADLGRLRVQECERVVALRTELARCGAKVMEEGDTLTVYPSKLHGAEIETYNDHRMAMCFAVLGLKVPGIKIKNPACVKKTFPNFFQKVAAPPPNGLGTTILDAKTGRKLEMKELFAD
jgi:3-phosphoshikimate 1-carboxyvinyltransferase